MLGFGLYLYVEAELLEAFQQGLFVAGDEGLEVGVDGRADPLRLLLHLQLDAEEEPQHPQLKRGTPQPTAREEDPTTHSQRGSPHNTVREEDPTTQSERRTPQHTVREEDPTTHS